jgi:hypothetical protein
MSKPTTFLLGVAVGRSLEEESEGTFEMVSGQVD